MMTQENEKVRKQMQMVCIDDLVPQNHLLRIIIGITIVGAFLIVLLKKCRSKNKRNKLGRKLKRKSSRRKWR